MCNVLSFPVPPKVEMPYKNIEDRQRRDRERYASTRDADIAAATVVAQAHRAAWFETPHRCPLCKALLERSTGFWDKACQHWELQKRGAKLTKKQKEGRYRGYYLRYLGR